MDLKYSFPHPHMSLALEGFGSEKSLLFSVQHTLRAHESVTLPHLPPSPLATEQPSHVQECMGSAAERLKFRTY